MIRVKNKFKAELRFLGLAVAISIILSALILPISVNAQIDEEQADSYFEEKYSIPITSIFAIRYEDGYNNAPKVVFGDESDMPFFKETLDFLDNHDLTSDSAYDEFISKHIDIDSYIDFHINAVYLSSSHWVEQNLTIWRLRDKEFSSKKINDTKLRFHIGELNDKYKYDETELINDILDKVQVDDELDEINFWQEKIFENLALNENFIMEYKSRLLYLINKNYETVRLTDSINNYSMKQQIFRGEDEGKLADLSTYEYAKILSDAKNFVKGLESEIMKQASQILGFGEISRIELSGFSKLSDIRMFFYDDNLAFSKKAENSQIYLYNSDTFTILDPKGSIRGYLVYQSGEFDFISGNILEISGDSNKTRVIAIKKFPHEYLLSFEGISVVLLLGILIFLIIRESRKRKRKKKQLWQ